MGEGLGERRRPLDFTNPANAAKIFSFLTAQAKSVSTYATNPLWQDRLRAVQAEFLQRHHRGVHHGAEPHRTAGRTSTPMSNFVGVPFTSDAAQFNAIKAGSVDVSCRPAGRRAASSRR